MKFMNDIDLEIIDKEPYKKHDIIVSYNFQIKQHKKSRDYRKLDILDSLSNLNPMMDRSFLINETIRRPNKDLIESDHLHLSSEIIDKNSI